MTTWRRFGFSCVASIVAGLAMGLAGCDGGGAKVTGPQEEVKLVAPVNEKGESLGLENESKQPPAK